MRQDKIFGKLNVRKLRLISGDDVEDICGCDSALTFKRNGGREEGKGRKEDYDFRSANSSRVLLCHARANTLSEFHETRLLHTQSLFHG
ncbi:hypothetical protein ALC60_09438 [Trachymyrmex zeteki]|uniref:Uncharacterized protein n=1 Tax=Mycetomoellerius zeteki TaxID=64791 RepID=A0A151WU57_9HYME|nr:hypothetical protein ALC60_09438 [Trachymyrmex zeteki]